MVECCCCLLGDDESDAKSEDGGERCDARIRREEGSSESKIEA